MRAPFTLAGPIVPYASRGPVMATLVFAGLTMTLAQIVSNVATVAVMVPLCVRSSSGFMLPSSAGSSAVIVAISVLSIYVWPGFATA